MAFASSGPTAGCRLWDCKLWDGARSARSPFLQSKPFCLELAAHGPCETASWALEIVEPRICSTAIGQFGYRSFGRSVAAVQGSAKTGPRACRCDRCQLSAENGRSIDIAASLKTTREPTPTAANWVDSTGSGRPSIGWSWRKAKLGSGAFVPGGNTKSARSDQPNPRRLGAGCRR